MLNATEQSLNVSIIQIETQPLWAIFILLTSLNTSSYNVGDIIHASNCQ